MANGLDGNVVARATDRIEWPTLAVAGSILAGLVGVIATYERVPAVVTIAGLGVLAAWYGSLRHEVVHGHPTPWPALNTALVIVPLGLTEPFWHYRDAHLRHHETDDLTDPQRDPESQYVRRSEWSDTHPILRAARIANTTLAGRLIVGPWFAAATVARNLRRQWRERRGRPRIVRFVLADVAVVVAAWATGLPVWEYLFGAVYVGTSLTLVRSYAEHRAVRDGSRTAVVRGRGFWALLFLNNNLHVTHHRRPDLAWYRLPTVHAASDADRVAAHGAGLYRGYDEVFRRFLFRPMCRAVDPLEREPAIVST